MNKKFIKYVSVLSVVVVLALVVSGCAQSGANMHAPSSGPYGLIYKYLGVPFQNLILATARIVGGKNAYAWGIVIISFVVRLLLLPLSLNQQYKSTTQQEKMRSVQPQLALLQEKQKEVKDPAVSQKLSALMMDIYKKNNLSITGGMGCLPLLLQMPILIAIYQAVQYSKQIGSAAFLTIPLGKPSFVIAIVATVFYIIQSWMSLQIVPPEQRKQMQMMLFMNPMFTFFISMYASAALALYFLVGGVVILIQQALTNYVMVPKVRRETDEYLKEHPIEVVVSEEILDKIINGSNNNSTSSADSNENTDTPKSEHDKIRELNKGKQNIDKK
ncbi:membrane protein insertase YidC [Companilactobacillus baiquanensis]|uniref:Membrane protein insertase YidC n=1 Tax=Companilactobacillus baiquanensis TaxID=2486005 RepID=A0ABW1UTA0_9LACO|nr:membrane protein insertase YidC [Companilactobacillus baiquanensis]